MRGAPASVMIFSDSRRTERTVAFEFRMMFGTFAAILLGWRNRWGSCPSLTVNLGRGRRTFLPSRIENLSMGANVVKACAEILRHRAVSSMADPKESSSGNFRAKRIVKLAHTPGKGSVRGVIPAIQPKGLGQMFGTLPFPDGGAFRAPIGGKLIQ